MACPSRLGPGLFSAAEYTFHYLKLVKSMARKLITNPRTSPGQISTLGRPRTLTASIFGQILVVFLVCYTNAHKRVELIELCAK